MRRRRRLTRFWRLFAPGGPPEGRVLTSPEQAAWALRRASGRTGVDAATLVRWVDAGYARLGDAYLVEVRPS